MRLHLYDGAGNTFALLDLRSEDEAEAMDPALLAQVLGGDPSEEARALGEALELEAGERALAFLSFPVDGVIVLEDALSDDAPPDALAHVSFRNADGTRPEACGNGLRCAAHHLFGEGPEAGDTATLYTDAGARHAVFVGTGAESESGATEGALLRLSMGTPRTSEPRTLDSEAGSHELTPVDMGNPHGVLFVEDVEGTEVEVLGPILETHGSFPEGANIGFSQVADGALHLRVWERGVGETQACGTGACAAAVAATSSGRLDFPVPVHLPGGTLTVHRSEDETLLLEGPSVSYGSAEVFVGGAAED